jgi:hypothetical protein
LLLRDDCLQTCEDLRLLVGQFFRHGYIFLL